MNKQGTLTILIFLVFTANMFAASLGDVNNNGIIDIVDALIIAQYYVGYYQHLTTGKNHR